VPCNTRLFGDTVNLASRVNGIAQGGQTILTEAVLDHAPPAWQGSVRPFDVTTVKGKAEPVQVYDLPWQTDDLTAIVSDNAPGSAAQPVRKQRLVLSYRDAETDLSDLDAPFSIGRAITNNLIVHATATSWHFGVRRCKVHRCPAREPPIKPQAARCVVAESSKNTHLPRVNSAFLSSPRLVSHSPGT